MNIAILAPHLRNSGGNKILFSYANKFIERGHQVTIYVRSTRTIRRTIANILQVGKPTWFPLKARVVRVHDWSPEHIGTHDHLIAGGYKEALAMMSWRGVPGVVWYMVQHDEGLYHGPRADVDVALKSSLRKIVVSSWLKDILRERAGQDSVLLLNPYDRTQFYATPKESHAGTRILILDHTFSWKGTEEAIQIVKNLKRKHPDIVFMGFGRRRKHIDSIYDEFYYDPPQEKIREIFSRADIFLCTSWDEGFGLPSLEAMACGTLVATYDNGGSRDFAQNGKTALVAPRRDSEALTAQLESALLDSALQIRLREAGRQFVEVMPTWDDQTDRFIDILESQTL